MALLAPPSETAVGGILSASPPACAEQASGGNFRSARLADQAETAVQIVAEVRGLTTMITQICAGHPVGRSRMAVIRHRAVSLNDRELAIAGEGGGFSVPAADLDHGLHDRLNRLCAYAACRAGSLIRWPIAHTKPANSRATATTAFSRPIRRARCQ